MYPAIFPRFSTGIGFSAHYRAPDRSHEYFILVILDNGWTLFDLKGNAFDPLNVMLFRYWVDLRVAEMLPFNYVPE